MFQLGRELKRWLSPRPAREGVAFGDPSLLELLDVKLLQAEARTADLAAGRIGAKDRAGKLVEAAGVWCELARRTGDPAALRKAAACAERAAELSRTQNRSGVLSEALCRQAEAALLGAELFGQEGLEAAAEYLLDRAPQAGSAQVMRASITGRRAIASGDVTAAKSAAAGFDKLLAAIGRPRRRSEVHAAAQLRRERGEILALSGARLNEPDLIRAGAADLRAAAGTLDGAYHPIALVRIEQARGLALVHQAEMTGDVLPAQAAVDLLQDAVDLVGPDHSPLDWARLHHALGLAWCALAEATASEPAFGRALQAFGKAQSVLSAAPNLALRALLAQDRAACLVRRAETCGDSFALDEAEVALRSELGALRAPPDPVAWAVLQLNLARVYLAQAELRGCDRGERARAGEALLGAFEVFTDRGLRSLALQAEEALQHLRQQAAAQR